MKIPLGRSIAATLSFCFASALLLSFRPQQTVRADSPGRIVATGNTIEPRFDHTATLLRNGKVLIAAGMARNGVIEPDAEVYDPHTGKFTSTGSMKSPRGWGVTATLLKDGDVLIAGGGTGSECDSSCNLTTAETYDPASGTFTAVGNMTARRAGANAARLQNGDVLIVGGDDASASGHTATAELYHPSTRTFSATGGMHMDGANTLIPMKNGDVLALGETGGELYDPSTGRFTAASRFAIGRTKFGAAPLPDGRLLIAGGQIGGAWGPKTAATNIYDPISGTFASGPPMKFTRFKLKKAVVPLDGGRVLIAGGAERPEIYDPASNSFLPTTGISLDSYYFSTATRLLDGEVLIVGGYSRPGGAAVNRAWLYQP
ncbi:MAG: kelch repeat-containing protein [Terracidiphilus sp.]